jgi:hypothetical protein
MAVEVVEVCATCALPLEGPEGQSVKVVLLALATATCPRVLSHVGCNQQQVSKRARDGA